jgi:hypothetical protein
MGSSIGNTMINSMFNSMINVIKYNVLDETRTLIFNLAKVSPLVSVEVRNKTRATISFINDANRVAIIRSNSKFNINKLKVIKELQK